MKKVLQSPQEIYEKKLMQEELLQLSKSFAQARMTFLYQFAQEKSKEDYFLNRDFYVVLVPTNTRDREMKPIDIPFARRSCPTPGYNQNVWKYHYQTGTLEFLWSIPRKAIYWWLYHNRTRFLFDERLKSRTAFVVMMESGELEKWVKKECGELPDAIITTHTMAQA